MLAPLVQGGDREATIRPQFDTYLGPSGPQGLDQPLEDGEDPVAAVGIARPQDRGDQLVAIPVEEQQGVIHVLAIVAVVGGAFLVAVGGIVGAIARHLLGSVWCCHPHQYQRGALPSSSFFMNNPG